MPLYTSPAIANSQPIAFHGERGAVQMARAVVTTTAALTTADTFAFFDMPANARVVGGYCIPSDMDTNGTPTLTFNLGDAGSGTRIISASTGAQTGTPFALPQAFIGYLYPAKTRVGGAVTANAATGVAGTIELCILYVVEDSATS